MNVRASKRADPHPLAARSRLTTFLRVAQSQLRGVLTGTFGSPRRAAAAVMHACERKLPQPGRLSAELDALILGLEILYRHHNYRTYLGQLQCLLEHKHEHGRTTNLIFGV
jgi:hypothetical protein